ncbi:cupin domain-containing protein [Fodinicola acaciae]|uniref:cupin domain-containing protein n=1 Tax=Fodinicola acaciae TaxID=2681555 RepID=UPI0013D8D0D6|nr:cupin domain-containing protein [Fodinicola acaciae]
MSVINAPDKPTHELPGTRFTSLATPSRGSQRTSVWQVDIEPGTPATPHELLTEEVFVVLRGEATVELGGETSVARPGDAIVVPPATLFALSSTGSENLRAICCMPAGGQAKLADGAAFTPPWAE